MCSSMWQWNRKSAHSVTWHASRGGQRCNSSSSHGIAIHQRIDTRLQDLLGGNAAELVPFVKLAVAAVTPRTQ